MGESNIVRKMRRLKKTLQSQRPYAIIVKAKSREECEEIVKRMIADDLLREDCLVYGDIHEEED